MHVVRSSLFPGPFPRILGLALAGLMSTAGAFRAAPAVAGVIELRDRETVLSARDAEFTGEIRWRGTPESVLSSWTRRGDRASWWVEAPASGKREISLIYSCAGGGGAVVEISCGSSRVTAEVHETGPGAPLLEVPAGLLAIPGGVSRIDVRAVSVPDPTARSPGLRGLVLEDGYVQLFDGESLEGWDTRYMRGEGYVVEDGRIVCRRKGGGNLYTAKDFGDFAFRFEFRLERCSNNGLGIRAEKGRDAAYYGLEIQILDNECPSYKDKIQPWQYHGSVYGVFPARRGFLRPTGEWNVEEVIARGHRITVRLNGVEIAGGDVSATESHLEKHVGKDRLEGAIGFLGHGSRVEFRDIRIRELAEEE